jgi:hypothetical protein
VLNWAANVNPVLAKELEYPLIGATPRAPGTPKSLPGLFVMTCRNPTPAPITPGVAVETFRWNGLKSSDTTSNTFRMDSRSAGDHA